MNNESRAKKTITVIEGDGVGPEITSLTVDLMRASGASIDVEIAVAGRVAFASGILSGVPQETLAAVEKHKVVLKGPLATPIGEGGKSANVTLRKTFEMFANIRPARELPGIPTPFSGRGIDLVIVRENVEDLYAGIEHMQTPNVAQCLKLISRVGSARIAEAAFAFALSQGRSSVVVATKANIMKLTEGLFKSEFERVAKGYPNIESSHTLIDNCAHQLVMKPEDFDVIVTTNMNGDILSDLASGLVGGLGFSPSVNLGYEVAMFEAVHGTAPDIAGKNKANPTAMILSGVMLLRHIDEFAAADRLEQALLLTLEEGIHTFDVPGPGAIGTREFAEAIEMRLGSLSSYPTKTHSPLAMKQVWPQDVDVTPASRSKDGLDVLIETREEAQIVAHRFQSALRGADFELTMISNRGTRVWPGPKSRATQVDHYRCRFLTNKQSRWSEESVSELLTRIGGVYRWMHIEKLESYNDQPQYSKAQGED
jgi:isocitrate dehydrogenase